MLQQLNSKIQGWFAWVIIVLIATTFALFGIEHYMQSRGANLAKAEVNGKPITIQEFELFYRRNQRANDSNELTLAAEQKRKKEMIEGLINKYVALQSAFSNGFFVSQSQVLTQIQMIPQFQQDGHFSINRYQQALSNALFTPAAFQAEVRDDILINQQHFAFSATAFALPSELDQFVKLYQQTRDYDYLMIPYQRFSQQVTVDAKAIEDYYQQHQQLFKSPEKVSLEYVRLSMPEIREKIQLADEQLKRYYDDNKSAYTTPAKWHVAHILFSIPKNATPEQQKKIEEKATKAFQLLKASPIEFEKLVKTQSDDKISALHGGVLPWITAGQSDFDKALVDLTTVGELSKPIKTAQGYEIFKVLAYTPSKLKSFDDVKLEIKEQLLTDEVQTEYARALEQLSDLAYQTPDSLSPIADALNLKIQQSELFSRKGGQADLTKNKNVLQAAFSKEVMSQGNNSEPVQVDNNTVVIVRVLKHVPAKEKKLTEIKDKIQAILVKQIAEQKANALGQMIVKAGNTADKVSKLIQENHLAWQSVNQADRNNRAVNEAINKIAFTLGREGSMSGESLPNGDFVVVHLKKIVDGRVNGLSKEQIASLLKNIEEHHGTVDYDLYMNAQLADSRIIRY